MTRRHAGIFASPVLGVWAQLVGATLLVGAVAEGSGVDPRLEASIALGAAAFKARLVILHFMELRCAPRAWRAAFLAWALLSAAGILGAYWAVADEPPGREPPISSS